MQKRGRAEKRELEFDGVRIPGLNKCTKLPKEQGELEVGETGNIYVIGDGQIKHGTIEGSYLDQKDTGVAKFFRDWIEKNQLKDVTYIRLDGHGEEIDRTMLPDCECLKAENVDYDAGGVTVSMVDFKISYYRPMSLS